MNTRTVTTSILTASLLCSCGTGQQPALIADAATCDQLRALHAGERQRLDEYSITGEGWAHGERRAQQRRLERIETLLGEKGCRAP